MRVLKTFARLGGIAVLAALLLPLSAQAQNDFGRLLAELSDADRLAMERARNEVLAMMERGALSMWKDDKTGHSGEARIARTYGRGGFMCADVEHVVKLPRESRYVIPFCRDGSGTWRAAF